MSDTGLAFINELKAQGYDTSTVEQLVRMANTSGCGTTANASSRPHLV